MRLELIAGIEALAVLALYAHGLLEQFLVHLSLCELGLQLLVFLDHLSHCVAEGLIGFRGLALLTGFHEVFHHHPKLLVFFRLGL